MTKTHTILFKKSTSSTVQYRVRYRTVSFHKLYAFCSSSCLLKLFSSSSISLFFFSYFPPPSCLSLSCLFIFGILRQLEQSRESFEIGRVLLKKECATEKGVDSCMPGIYDASASLGANEGILKGIRIYNNIDPNRGDLRKGCVIQNVNRTYNMFN